MFLINLSICDFSCRINCLLDVRASCKTVPNLNREQLELCYRASDVTIAAIEGLEQAVRECQHQVKYFNYDTLAMIERFRRIFELICVTFLPCSVENNFKRVSGNFCH